MIYSGSISLRIWYLEEKRRLMGDNAIFKAAIKIANEAIQLDSAKNYDQAADKYIQACETLTDFAKFCKNTKLQALAREKAVQYYMILRNNISYRN